MNRTRTALAAGTVLLLAACSSPLTYAESVEQCTEAIKRRATPSPVRPKPCEPLNDHDYMLIISDKAMHDLGWLDENGNPDINRMLTSKPSP